jgi:putative membrane protein
MKKLGQAFLPDPWLAAGARERVRERIVAIEAKTGAELVVTVGTSSGRYGHADARFGAFCSLCVLLFYFLYPRPLIDDVWLALAVLCYPAGMLFCSAVWPLRRRLLRKRVLRENVAREARSRFVEQGIADTKSRAGVLIFVSRFERAAEVVPDSGVPVKSIGKPWQEAVAVLDRAARRRRIDDFLTALDRLGDLLATAVPHRPDDVNELPDEVRA